MSVSSKRRLLLLSMGAAIAPKLSFAQSSLLRIVVPFSPGGGLDACARLIADGMVAQSRQTIVENKPGAGGNIGVEFVVNARPDGHTILMASHNNVVFGRHLYKNLRFDPIRDLAPVALVCTTQSLVLVNPKNVPVNSLGELVKFAKSAGRSLNMGSAGNASGNHIIGELFQHVAGVKFTHVPYPGAGPAMKDLIGGHIDLVFDSLPSSLGYAKEGTVRAIAITGKSRHPSLPNVQSYAEAGYAAASVTAWNGLLAPKATPAAAITELTQAVEKMGASQKFRDGLDRLGLTSQYLPPAQFAELIAADSERWGKVLGELNITI